MTKPKRKKPPEESLPKAAESIESPESPKSIESPESAESPPATRPPALRLEYIDPEDLEGNPSNWRRHPTAQLTAIKDLVDEAGWAGALLFNERTNKLIDGHARKELFAGKGPVPVLVGSWDEATEKKILASLDPLAGMAEVDNAALEALLRDVDTQSAALKEVFAGLLEVSESGDKVELKPLEVRPPPAMTWALVGIATVRFGEISEAIEKMAAIPGVVLETTSNDG